MIFGIGVDLIDVASFDKELELNGRDFIERLFTPAEIGYCETKRYKAQNYAARFAAKEALLKALGTGLRNGFRWLEIETSRDDLGRPHLHFSGKVRQFIEEKKIINVQVSLSHTREMAVAYVTLEHHEEQ